MEPILIVQASLQRLAWRRRWIESLRGLAIGLLWGSAIWAIAVVAYKIAPLPPHTPQIGAAVGGLVACIGFLRGFWKAPSLIEMARWLDQEKGLQERLSTSLELSERSPGGDWQKLVLQDAVSELGKIDTRQLLPLRIPRAAFGSLALLLLILGLAFVPEYRSPAQLQKAEEAKVMSETGKELADLVRQQLEARKPMLEPTEKVLNETLEFGEKLTQVHTTKADALRELTRITQKAEEQLQKLEDRPPIPSLEKAAHERSSGANPAELQQRADALKQAMGSAAGKNEAIEKLKQNLEKLGATAKNVPAGDSAEAQAAREQLAQSLSDIAQQAKEAGIPLSSLDEAINALKNANSDFFLRDLGAALQELDKLQQLGQNLQQLQQEMAKQAKDLAEQLKMGQAKAAQATLQKMIDQLRSAALTPEQLQSLIQEISKSLGPAKDYGKVAEHLKKAADKLASGSGKGDQRGKQSEAAQSLADASKELEDLMQQMAEGDQLAAMLDSLQQAQRAISSGKGFGQCKNPGRPRFGPGGKPGKGVGTWAEEEGWTQIPEQSKGWDNSGIQQSEMDSKGLTDRGEGEHNPNLAPTKVKGQFSPGGSMQSITLKGVHIRGQSQVKLTEAAAAAQADAQNALNQDKVPRAYQQSVRDYFDDLKK